MLEKIDYVIILGMVLIVVLVTITLYEIFAFSPILASCTDDFAIINKCGIVPCSWSDQAYYNNLTHKDCNMIFGVNLTKP